MKNRRVIPLALATVLLATLSSAAAAVAGSDPLVGTWHERDFGFSNIFYFVDEPVGGVYHVLYYDDHTGENPCGDHGPMLWAGFARKTSPNTLEGSFGINWCPDNGDGPQEGFIGPTSFILTYDPDTDTITGIGECVGTRQPQITTLEKAIQELAKGKYPPSGVGPIGCEGANLDEDTVRIKVTGSEGTYFQVTSDQEIEIWWRWIACSRGLVREFLGVVNQNSHELDGQSLFDSDEEANELWRQPRPFGALEACVGDKDHAWVTFWEHELGELEPGTYELHSVASLAQPLTDGADSDGDGNPDVFDGILFDTLITIVVVEPP